MTKPDNSSPLVTVYMPTYNRVALLQRAVESVLSQDYRNIELIVVDDNSTDGTHQYLAEMAEKDSRFRYLINEKNSGACVSRNKAIFAANGEYITGIDDDDYYLTHHISTFIQYWNRSKSDCVALYSDCYVKKKHNEIKSMRKIKKCSSRDLIAVNWIGNQIFTKTEYLKQIGGFDENLLAWQDLECWYRLLNFYNKKAYSTGMYSYTIDQSHPHERITTKKISSVISSYEYFCKKYNLSTTDRSILKLQLSPYTQEQPVLKEILKKTAYQLKPYKIKASSKIIISFIINKITA